MIWYPAPPADQAAERAAGAFVRAYGYRPHGIWTAPGRINLIGEHVDYNAGLCFPLALAHRAYAAIAPRDDNVIRLHSGQVPAEKSSWQGSLDHISPGGAVSDWPAYVAGTAWALGQHGHPVRGFDCAIESNVPLGSGLSSSAALECCVATGLDDLFSLGMGSDQAGRQQLVQVCMQAENEIAGAPTGGMDQAAAMLATSGHALLLDCQDFSVSQVSLGLEQAGLALLVVDTRAHHSLVDGQYGSRRELCERVASRLGVSSLRDVADSCPDLDALSPALEIMAREPDADQLSGVLRHVVTEIHRVRQVAELLRADKEAEIGPIMNASHASLRDDYRVSCAELDVAVESARAAGALGARMTGGGFGGSAIALIPAAGANAVAAAVADRFRAAEFTEPAFLLAIPSGSAQRIG